MGTRPHSVVRLSGIEADYGDTIAVVDDQGNAHYWSWRDFDWISMGMVPDSIAYESYLPPKKSEKKHSAKKGQPQAHSRRG